VALVGIASGYVLLISRFELPEERLHFLEYGIVGGLVFAALLERQEQTRGKSGEVPGGYRHFWPAVGAVVFTGIAGWVDEGIQELLPNRFYDLRDVAMNVAAGVLAVFSIWILDLARQAGEEPRA
jgi:hypothetical protein